MSNYTQTVHELFIEHYPDTDFRELANVEMASKALLFTPDILSYIPEVHRDAFATQFALHYISDEFGSETMAMWQINLLEHVVNNEDYIKLLYDNLDKQVFATYRVRKVTDDGASHENVTNISTMDQTSTDKLTGTTGIVTDGTNIKKAESQDGKVNTTSTSSGASDSDYSNDTGSVSNGTSTTAHTGTDITDTTHDGNSTVTANHTGEEDVTKTHDGDGTATHSANYTETKTPTGSKTTTIGAHTDTTEVGDTDTTSKSQVSDTPQNGLSPVESGAYLSNAAITSTSGGGHTDRTTVGAHTTTETYSAFKDTLEHSQDSANNKDTTSDNSTDTSKLTNSGTDTTVSDDTSTDKATRTLDTTDATSTHEDSTNTQTGHASGTDTVASSGSSEQITPSTSNESDVAHQTSNTTDDKTNAHTGKTDVNGDITKDGTDIRNMNDTEYTLTQEALLKAEPLMSRLWHIFDDLFMSIYDSYDFWR